MIAPELLARLRQARESSGLRLEDVCEKLRKARGEFRPDPPALSRKLRGVTPISIVEANELAICLGVDLRWSLRKRRATA